MFKRKEMEKGLLERERDEEGIYGGFNICSTMEFLFFITSISHCKLHRKLQLKSSFF